VPRYPYLKRIVRAHLIHHKTLTKRGAVSFGFLYAPEFPPAQPRVD
jgi:beta-carotene 3-hydroxylase